MKGTLIVIEGLDGSGKGTQTEKLFHALSAQGRQVRGVSFPNYESESSALVKMYLRGDFGSDPGDVNPYAASAFYAVDRYAGYKQDWGGFYRAGGMILADRYTTSNAIYQCSKLPREQWAGFLDWMFAFEYEQLGIPAPDQVFYLRTDTAVSQRLMSERYQGDEGKKDIHERDLRYLNHAQQAADYCAERLGWRTIQCSAEGAMRTVEDIHQELLGLIPRKGEGSIT
ncbi:MAG: thymidylate kinase [Oscillospiraceae bacterium]|nr:thymidylate kinase [Oscillospiraceae bacterium]